MVWIDDHMINWRALEPHTFEDRERYCLIDAKSCRSPFCWDKTGQMQKVWRESIAAASNESSSEPPGTIGAPLPLGRELRYEFSLGFDPGFN